MRDPRRATVTPEDREVRKGETIEEKVFKLLVQMFLLGTAASGEAVDAARFDQAAVAWAADHGADLITRIDADTRDRARGMVEDALQENLSIHEFQERLQEDPRGLFGRDRALMIARTETAFAFNQGEATRWSADGVRYVEIIDGDLPDTDKPCKTANGQTWTIEEYQAHPIAHPNCQRSAIPLLDEFIEPSKLGFSIDP